MSEEQEKYNAEDSVDVRTGIDLPDMKGAFVDSLTRNNSQIRKDRAIAIAEDAYTEYRRDIEDTLKRIRDLKREQENMLDMSPDNAMNLRMASNFNAEKFVERDKAIAVQLRQEFIVLEETQKRFKHLFGGK